MKSAHSAVKTKHRAADGDSHRPYLDETGVALTTDDSWATAVKPLIILGAILGAGNLLLCLFSPEPTNPDQEWKIKHDQEMSDLRKEFNGQ